MAYIDRIDLDEKETLWSDRKRILGMPISFTHYTVDEERLYIKTGVLKTQIDEILLYRILDVKTSQSIGQRMLGVGTVTLFSADQNNRTVELKNIKDPKKLHRFISDMIEEQRTYHGIAGREMIGAAGMPPMDDEDLTPHHGAPPPAPPMHHR